MNKVLKNRVKNIKMELNKFKLALKDKNITEEIKKETLNKLKEIQRILSVIN